MKIIVISLIASLALLALSPWIDLNLSTYIYQSHDGFYRNDLLHFLFVYGPWPAWAAGFLSLFILFANRYFPKLKPYKGPALLFVLSFAIGSLLVNGVFKEFWPRPRPLQVEGLGGTFPYRNFFEPLFGAHVKSFPSGHASVGFVFFALYFAGRKWHMKGLKISGLVLAISLGLLLSFMRIVMGCHFFSDVVFSAALMWFLPLGFLKIWKN